MLFNWISTRLENDAFSAPLQSRPRSFYKFQSHGGTQGLQLFCPDRSRVGDSPDRSIVAVRLAFVTVVTFVPITRLPAAALFVAEPTLRESLATATFFFSSLFFFVGSRMYACRWHVCTRLQMSARARVNCVSQRTIASRWRARVKRGDECSENAA